MARCHDASLKRSGCGPCVTNGDGTCCSVLRGSSVIVCKQVRLFCVITVLFFTFYHTVTTLPYIVVYSLVVQEHYDCHDTSSS